MEQEEVIYTKKEVIEKYKPMFTEYSLSKLIREKKLKHIRIRKKDFYYKKRCR